MPEIRNSTRALYTATYVPVRASRDGALGRGLQKLSLIRALKLTPSELRRLVDRDWADVPDAERPLLLDNARKLEELVVDQSLLPRESVRQAAHLSAPALIRMAQVILEERVGLWQKLADTATALRTEDPGTFGAPTLEPATPTGLGSRAALEVLHAAAVQKPEVLESALAQRLGPRVLPEALALVKHPGLAQLGIWFAALIGFSEQMKVEPVGRLHLERLEMYPAGVERGELVSTLALAPQEVVTISHKEWSWSDEEYTTLVQDSFEGYSERGVAEKNDAAMSTETETRHSNSFNFGASLSGGFAGVSVSSSFGFAQSSEDQEARRESISRSQQVTAKASARTRKEHKVTFKLETRHGVEDASFRTITNPFADKSVRLDYFRLMRKWRTDLYRYGLRLTYDIAVPNPGAALWAKYERLRDLEAQIAEPFVFSVSLTDIDPEDPSSWTKLGDEYGVALSPPPSTLVVSDSRLWTGPEEGGAEAVPLVAPDGYRFSDKATVTGVYYSDLVISFSGEDILVSPGGAVNYEVGAPPIGGNFKASISGGLSRGDKLGLTVIHGADQQVGYQVNALAEPKASVIAEWRQKSLEALRKAAEASHTAQIERLKDERDLLYQELVARDALSLRKLEREEIVRSTLTWLLGPLFDPSPGEIETTIDAIVQNFAKPEPVVASFTEHAWEKTLGFGEFVKFLHQAVEWENVVYLLYPYFWGSDELAGEKVYFEHPDPTHRDFLKAGFARVVLTIRPGFERDFTNVLETGSFGSSVETDAYMTIADELAAYARTNYPGVPPANSEKHARPLLYPEQRATWDVMQGVIRKIEDYHATNDAYPSSLSELDGAPFVDWWGNELVYRSPGSGADYDLVSLGADGAEGGEEKDADISASATASLIGRWYDYTPTSGIDIEIDAELATIA